MALRMDTGPPYYLPGWLAGWMAGWLAGRLAYRLAALPASFFLAC